MTAEAMVCRHFLGLPADEPDAAREAGESRTFDSAEDAIRYLLNEEED